MNTFSMGDMIAIGSVIFAAGGFYFLTKAKINDLLVNVKKLNLLIPGFKLYIQEELSRLDTRWNELWKSHESRIQKLEELQGIYDKTQKELFRKSRDN